MLAFAHRGGAYHPELEGLENTLAAFRHAVGARLPLPRDRRPRHPRRRAAGLPRPRSSTGSPTGAGAIADARPAPRSGAALVGGRERVPTLAELRRGVPRGPVQHRPQVRRRRSPPLAAFIDERGADGPGARRLVLAAPPARRSAGSAGPRVPTSAHPLEVALFRRPAQRPAGRPAHPRPGRPRCRSPTGAGAAASPPPGSYAGPTPPASTCTSGPSTTPTRCASCSTVVSTA